MSFNSRARVGRDPAVFISLATANCFNSRARVGRDVNFDFPDFLFNGVSTHAPAWGATQLWLPLPYSQ